MQHRAWRISGGGGIGAHIAFKNDIYLVILGADQMIMVN